MHVPPKCCTDHPRDGLCICKLLLEHHAKLLCRECIYRRNTCSDISRCSEHLRDVRCLGLACEVVDEVRHLPAGQLWKPLPLPATSGRSRLFHHCLSPFGGWHRSQHSLVAKAAFDPVCYVGCCFCELPSPHDHPAVHAILKNVAHLLCYVWLRTKFLWPPCLRSTSRRGAHWLRTRRKLSHLHSRSESRKLCKACLSAAVQPCSILFSTTS